MVKSGHANLIYVRIHTKQIVKYIDPKFLTLTEGSIVWSPTWSTDGLNLFNYWRVPITKTWVLSSYTFRFSVQAQRLCAIGWLNMSNNCEKGAKHVTHRARSSRCCSLTLSHGLVLHKRLTSLDLFPLDRTVQEKLLWLWLWPYLPDTTCNCRYLVSISVWSKA